MCSQRSHLQGISPFLLPFLVFNFSRIPMKNLSLSVLSTTLLATLSFSAHAQTVAPAAAQTYELAYNVGVVSDYRYRGVSQTRLQPAVQGGVDLTVGSFYAGVWASNIQWIKDAGGNAKVELDVYGGYKYELAKDITLDFGALSYQYPNNKLSPSANTTEAYVGIASGAYSAKYSRSMSNLFGFSSSKGSGYLEANLDYELVKGTNLVAHLGHQTVKNGSDFSYNDYKIGATYEALGGKLAASIIGTDNKNYVSPKGKNLGKAGVVLGYTKNF
jgi:uncharacterized protein (TIGR02001 family)